MRDLLPHYERELGFLSDQAQRFAERYPRIAGRLSTSGNLLEDPHVERLVQSFALLSARVHKRLDDDFPRVTEALLDVLSPHYLRPFPACSIACFAPEPGLACSELPAGTTLLTRPVRGVACRFRTVYPVFRAALRLVRVRWTAAPVAPSGTLLPRGCTSLLSFDFELDAELEQWAEVAARPLRLYVDGDTSLVSAAREALTAKGLACYAGMRFGQAWERVSGQAPQLVGLDPEQMLLGADARDSHAHQLLTEYLAFPEKFNFIDLPLPAQAPEDHRFSLHVPLAGLRADGNEARLLEALTPRNFRLGCTPVINLFPMRAEPIRVTQHQAEYTVLADARRAFAYEVHSVERVFRVQQTPQGESIQRFEPFFSLQHEALLEREQAASEGQRQGRYWALHRDLVTAELAPGHECELTLVDLAFDPAAPQTDSLSIDIQASNRDLPHQISIGQQGGDLFSDAAQQSNAAQLLRKPTRSERFDCDHGALWRLVSQLSLNHLTLSGAGLEGLKELLRLHDLPRAAGTRRLIDGLRRLDIQPSQAWLPGNPFPSLVRGSLVQLAVDPDAFVGSGLFLFAQVLDRYLGQCVQINSFVQLRLVHAQSGDILVECPRRSGSGALL